MVSDPSTGQLHPLQTKLRAARLLQGLHAENVLAPVLPCTIFLVKYGNRIEDVRHERLFGLIHCPQLYAGDRKLVVVADVVKAYQLGLRIQGVELFRQCPLRAGVIGGD